VPTRIYNTHTNPGLGRKKVKMNDEIIKTLIKAAEKESGRWDYSQLPKVQQASVHVARNKRNGANVEASGYIVYVQCGGKWRPANEVLHYYGFKTATAVYTDKAKAEAYIEKITKTWGVVAEKKERKSKKPSATATLAAILKATGLTMEDALQMVAENEKKAAA
jgi:hypothetical protein